MLENMQQRTLFELDKHDWFHINVYKTNFQETTNNIKYKGRINAIP